MDQSSLLKSGISGVGRQGLSHASSHQGLPSYQPQVAAPSGAHSLIDFQGQLNNLKSSLLNPPSSEKHFMSSIQWNIDGTQKNLEKIIEEIEGKRLPAVKSYRPLVQPTYNPSQNFVLAPSNGYKEWKQYVDPKRKLKSKREEREAVVPEPSPLAGINPLSFTIKKVR